MSAAPFACMRVPRGTPAPIEAGPLLAERQAERDAAMAHAGTASSIPIPTLPLDGTPWSPLPAHHQRWAAAAMGIAFVAAVVLLSCITHTPRA